MLTSSRHEIGGVATRSICRITDGIATCGGLGSHSARLVFADNNPVVNIRACLVSFTDTEGINHSVRISAQSLYEAAIEAMAAFHAAAFAEMILGPATQLRIRVRAPDEEHTISVGKVLSWLDGGATSPMEQVKKNRLKERGE